MYSFTVYLGSSIYSPGVPQLVAEFGVSELVGSLGLALYVLACMHLSMIVKEINSLLTIDRRHRAYDIFPSERVRSPAFSH